MPSLPDEEEVFDHYDQLRLAISNHDLDNATTNESETSGSRRLSEDFLA